MASFLIDEDMARSLAPAIRAVGLQANDVRDAGLRGRPDAEVFRYALAQGMVLVTADMGFANTLQFPPPEHAGIVIARFPNEMPTATVNTAVVSAIQELSDGDFVGNTIIVEPGRVRMRRKG